ncbi:MAG: ERCC4 domain-containing protein [Nanoarchaeota archaeon]|mgnify:CR=1 FL=1
MPLLDIFSKKQVKIKEKPKITIDYREKNSLIPSELIANGCEIEFHNLSIGDYIIGNVIIERKTISDFLSSMVNKHLLNQLQHLQNAEKKILIIEGTEEKELYHEQSGINENAIRGFMLSIILSYNVPIIITKNSEDTAKFLYILAKKQPKEISLKLKRKSQDVNEQIQYIIESFPGIGPKSAKKLLNHFKTIKNIINADEEDLKKVIGKKSDIFKLAEKMYTEDNHD